MRNRLTFKIIFFAITYGLVAALFSSNMNAGILGDRLILAVNNVPYSQLQIEGYLNVKETLREDLEKSSVVTAENWPIALAAFIKDMVIYQEATKSSGFRPQKDGVQKALERIHSTLPKSPAFQRRFKQLGLDNATIKEHLSRVLTVENLRRSRQGLDKNKERATAWEDELEKVSIIRWFDKGRIYEDINPVP